MSIQSLPYAIAVLFVLCSNYSQAQNLLQHTLHFETAESELNEGQRHKLSKIADSLKQHEWQSIVIAGHTDHVGSEQANLALAKCRANAVRSFFEKEGITITGTTTSRGEAEPIASNHTALGRSQNRRVDLIIKFASNKKSTIESPPQTDPLSALLRSLQPKSQHFCIQSDRDTVLVGEQGTILYFQANSFELPGGKRSSCVELAVKERFKKSEIFREMLTTKAGEDILASGGMLQIEAEFHGEPVTMVKDLLVLSPTDTILPEMNLYNGFRDAKGHMQWTLDARQPNGMGGDQFICNAQDFVPQNFCPLFFCKFKAFFTRLLRSPNPEDSTLIPFTVNTLSNCNEQWTVMKQDFEQQYGGFSADRLKDIPQQELQYYVFNRRLGWGNLDWLMKVKRKTKYQITAANTSNTKVSMLFKKQCSMVALEPKKNRFQFSGAPLDYKAWIIGLRADRQQPELALQEIVIDKKGLSALSFEPLSASEIIEKLKILDE